MSERPPRRVDINLLRPVPGATPVHRLWAGTKIVAVGLVGLVLFLRPSWSAIGVMAALTAVALVVARVPLGAAPRLPRWFLVAMAISFVLAVRAGGPPDITVGGLTVGLDGLAQWTRFLSLTVVLFAAACLVSWTTPLAEVAPALDRLGTPLRWLRLPVREWATVVALSLRCFPLLLDELRTLAAARRLRQHPPAGHGRRRRGDRLAEPLNLLATALVVATRRAREMGAAIEARGGLGAIADAPSRPARRDAIALVIVVVAAMAAYLL